MCDLNNAGPRMPQIPQSTLALDRNYWGLEIGCGAPGVRPIVCGNPTITISPHPGTMDATDRKAPLKVI